MIEFRKDYGNIEDLKKSISEIGLLHPIVVDSDGVIIAGRRRLRACQELGIEAKTVVIDFDDPERAQIDENTIRKDFTPSEIHQILQYINEKDSRQRDGLKQFTGNVRMSDSDRRNKEHPRDKVAKITGKSTDTLSKINQLFDKENGADEETKQKVDEGKVSVDKAYKEFKKKQKQETKKEEFKKASIEYKNDDIKIFYQKFQDGSQNIQDNSVDAIITDPPYPIEYIDLWQDMFDVADRILKPSSFLVAYANHQNLDLIFKLPNPLKYYWIFKLDFTAKPIAMGRNLIATWKPVLVYQKMPFKKIETTIEDRVKELKKFDYNERDLHEDNWGQSLGKFEYLIDVFTKPGDLIVEPFAGTGTTLVAAKNMKRKCIGYEIEEEKYKSIIEGRIVKGI
jgi:hypothetical protein